METKKNSHGTAIYSMTGSAHIEQPGEYFDFTIDLVSVNSRFLEIYLKLPDSLRHLDATLRTMLKNWLTRGKIDVIISLKMNEQASLCVNEDFLKSLATAVNAVTAQFPAASVNALEILQYPGVLAQTEQQRAMLDEKIITTFEEAIDILIRNREQEGQRLVLELKNKLNLISAELDNIAPILNELSTLERQRLLDKVNSLLPEPDPQRIEQEVVLAAQKSDIAEEYDRLRSHISETLNILKTGGNCGKRLDFLMQEFNREANTMASKASSLKVTKTAVELKVLIEQLREQVQNIE
ncbi:MAG: YicC family protein [Succinivibrio sp.]|nr:YicC family protein [Succinivibrio sp.]